MAVEVAKGRLGAWNWKEVSAAVATIWRSFSKSEGFNLLDQTGPMLVGGKCGGGHGVFTQNSLS